MSDRVRVGLFTDALEATDGDPERLRATLGRVADAGVDHLCVGDHVSFFVGAGSDGLIGATSLLAVQAELPVYVGLYLLPLRHPVTVARQLATIAQPQNARRRHRLGRRRNEEWQVDARGAECCRQLRASSSDVQHGGRDALFRGTEVRPALEQLRRQTRGRHARG